MDHRLVGSFVYNLPIGRGERVAGDATGVKNAVIGGWQLNGIYTWQRGFPITIQAADLGGLNDASRPEPCRSRRRPRRQQPDDRRGGSIPRRSRSRPPGASARRDETSCAGPAVNNLDLAAFKNFELGKGTRVQFRLESFNAFNHTQFNGVSTNLTSSNFGVVTSARPGRINQLGLKFIF